MTDERPVADRIEGVPTPAEHDLLVGHDRPLEAFLDALRTERLHHAWLLAGPKGIGKATAAFRMAADVLSRGSDRSRAEVLAQVGRGGHPGLLVMSRPWDEKAKRFRAQLPIDGVRKSQAFFGLTAGGGERRVCIVDAADDMNASSANALLKVLEEPPARSLFFVIAHSPGRLLPTIRSRCRTLAFSPLTREGVEEVIGGLMPSADRTDVSRVARSADGAPRNAFTMLQGDVLPLFDMFERLANQMTTKGGRLAWNDVHKLAEAAAKGGDFDAFLDLVFSWIAERMRAEVATGGSSGSLVRWPRLWEEIGEARNRAAVYNLDKKQVILDLFTLLSGSERATAAR